MSKVLVSYFSASGVTKFVTISNKRFTGRESDEDYINWIK